MPTPFVSLFLEFNTHITISLLLIEVNIMFGSSVQREVVHSAMADMDRGFQHCDGQVG